MQNYSQHLSKSAAQHVAEWLCSEKYEQYKDEVEALIEQEKWQELEDAFYKKVTFGTGGIRGEVGLGSARINRVTIGEATQALCRYAQSIDATATEKGIVIACDTRNSSEDLTRYTAEVAAASGMRVYVFDGFRATPQLSFAIRDLGCAVGVVISASHNPPKDNGFKAYWSDGGQLVAPHDAAVVQATREVERIEHRSYAEAVEAGVITILDGSADERYWSTVLDQGFGVDVSNVNVVFSPLHGVGQTSTLPILRKAGCGISIVEEQMTPDGNFPTIENHQANPEQKAANAMAVQQLLDEKADIAITNDPDADRVGVVVRHNNEAVYLSGNQTSLLVAQMILKNKRQDTVSDPYIVKTIVTTDGLNALAEEYGVTVVDNLLVGFRYIGRTMTEKAADKAFCLLGAEESFGISVGEYTRDKDGAAGALLIAECAAEAKRLDKTLVDVLHEIYETHGLFTEQLATLVYPGARGFTTMQAIMQSLRDQAPDSIAQQPVTSVLDYQTLVRTDCATKEASEIDCDAGNVLVYELGKRQCRVTIRPSGTEPKLKLYVQWHSTDMNQSEAVALTDEIIKDIERIALARA